MKINKLKINSYGKLKNKEIDLLSLLNKTKYGKDGIGGIKSYGMMYVGYPR